MYITLHFAAGEVHFPILDTRELTTAGTMEGRIKGLKVAYILTPEIELPSAFFK